MTSLASVMTRVLLVEDNQDHASLIRAYLTLEEREQFTLHHAARLNEALEHLRRDEFDIVLLDLGLPDATGLESFERIRQLIPGIPVVILTAMDDQTAAAMALHNGAQDYVLKDGLDPGLLTRTIRHAIERNRAVRELDSVTTQLRAANTRLERMTLLDPLTQVLNRRGLQRVLSREIQWSRRHSSELLAMLLDLDNFKRINDTLGHVVGDVVLRDVAGKLKAALRATDYVARLGGDEFFILLPQTGPVEGMQIAEKVRLAVAESPIGLSTGVLSVSASLGVAPVSEGTPSVDELLSLLHFVLSESKKGGKNRVSYQNREQDRDATSEPLSATLQMLLRGDSFRVVAEPIFRLADEQVIGYEFLSRLPAGVFEVPDDFFRLSLEANILTLVDHRCFKACVAEGASFPPTLRRHLNLFPSTLIDIPVQHLLETFPKDRHEGGYCIEISEQQIVGDPANLAPAVVELKRAGVLVAFDDVGFGRSCLESLTLLEPDIIKIDKSCVTGIAAEPLRLRSLKRLLKLSEALGAEVVAEGIESRDDLGVLIQLGVRYGQGFLWREQP